MNPYLAAYERHNAAACVALQQFQAMAPRSRRVPGMDTVIRLAWRIECGRSVEEAAAREYLYRWRLALDALGNSRPGRANVFADHYAPHLLGI